MISYANYLSVVDDIIVVIMKIIQEKLGDGTTKKAILASCDSIVAGIQKAYDVFKTGYSDAKEGKKPDFTHDVDFPPAPPTPSSYSDGVSWFQLSWNAIRSILDAIALKSTKLAEFIPIVTAAGDKLVEDLDKAFGKPKDKPKESSTKPQNRELELHESFPTLKSRKL